MITTKQRASLRDQASRQAYRNVLDWLQRLPIGDVQTKITGQLVALDERAAKAQK